MSNVLLCQGKYSKIPYFLKDDCRNIYCIEELCYYLYHNAYLLDDSFVCFELADWIKNDLGLSEVSVEINKICGRSGALLKLVRILAENIGFYTDKEWQTLLDDIGDNNELSVEERRKIRADGFLNAGKYGLAFDEYEVIIRDTKVSEVKLRAKVFHNLGVCSAKLFMYEKAAEFFERAYDTYANTESYISMLSAMKMYMPPSDYLSYLSSHKESYEDSLEVERKFDSLNDSWQSNPAYLYIKEIEGKKVVGGEYYDDIDTLTEEVKSEYREQVFRGRTGGF